MPRVACAECRSRKIKCIAPASDAICERCITRQLRCSNVTQPAIAPSGRGSFERQSPTSQRTAAAQYSASVPSPRRPPLYTAVPRLSENPVGGHDIGRGTPREILRENEFTVELLRLYFSNFSDIHFMFDQETFIRQFSLGESAKVILFSMMALGIRYSDQPGFDHMPRSSRGESLFREARELLKADFDHPSLTTIQAYVLLSTYYITFGGSKKSWLYLGMASNLIKALRITDDSLEIVPLKREMHHRLIATIVLMDHTLSPSINLPCYFGLTEAVPRPCDEEEFRNLKLGLQLAASNIPRPNLIGGILDLSHLFAEVCLYHRQGGTLEQWQDLESKQALWQNSLHESLIYNQINLEHHLAKKFLRPFSYLHLLYHHICQLLYFPFLQTSGSGPEEGPWRTRSISCHYHASRVTEILQDTWKIAGSDVHNVSVGQILTVAAAIQMHACMTARSSEHAEAVQAAQANLAIITDCLDRIRESCRVFDRVSTRLDTFLKTSTSRSIFDKNQRLIRHILHYGTASERNYYRTADPTIGIGDTSNSITPSNEPVKADVPAISTAYLDWLASLDGATDDGSFENCAWIFANTSLNDLSSISFMDTVLNDVDMFVEPFGVGLPTER